VIVVGGSYSEVCARPSDRRLRGSGLRAAIALRAVEPQTELITAISDEESDELSAVAGAFGLRVAPQSRNGPITFSYFTPVSPPAIDGVGSRVLTPIKAGADTVLRFGLIEQVEKVSIDCQTLVVDPQGDNGPLPTEGARYDRLAVIANEREIRRLAGHQDLDDAARAVLSQFGADAVVVKCGAIGSMVFWKGGSERIGPRPTPHVRPIGSGDVFTAAFAHAYGQLGADPVSAARIASSFTAAFVGSRTEPAFQADNAPLAVPFGKRNQIYLAGPFFGLGQEWLVDLVRTALRELGATAFSPVHDVGRGGPEVAKADLDAIDRSAAVLALLDGFDPGTVFEIGYAVRMGKPIAAYLDPGNLEQLTMFEGSGVEVMGDLSTAIYRSIWLGMAAGG
jgi:nucleoside 2-deoxyribosyltransferase